MSEAQEPRDFEPLLDYLRRTRGFDFTAYKRPSLMRRMQKRMQTVGIERFADYMDYLEVHPDEFSQLFNSILINVTAFFRDESSWDLIRDEIIPLAIGDAGATHTVRVWSAGCASGEETYSIAMLLAEALGRDGFRDRVKIYATDVDDHALGEARVGELQRAAGAAGTAGSARALFRARERSVRVRQGSAAVGDLRAPRSDPGRADLARQHPHLPQHADVLQHRGAEPDSGALPFRALPGRGAVSRQGGDDVPRAAVHAHRPAPPRVQEDRQGRVARPDDDHESGGRGRRQRQRLERTDVSGGVRRRATCADRVRFGRRPGDGQRSGALALQHPAERSGPADSGPRDLVSAAGTAIADRPGDARAPDRHRQGPRVAGARPRAEILRGLDRAADRRRRPHSWHQRRVRRHVGYAGAAGAADIARGTISTRPTRSCSRPTRNWRRRTKSCSRRSKSWKRPTRSCSRPTRSWRR